MVRNRKIKLIITPLQNRLLEDKAKALGYGNKNDYIRSVILCDDCSVQEMVNEIYEGVCNVRR